MSEFFLNIVNMSISASWVVLAVLLLRLLLKKAPKWVNVLLWGIVAIRLICPFSFESAFSLMPGSKTIGKAPDSPRPYFESGVTIIDNQVNDYLKGAYFEGVTKPANHFADVTTVLAFIWIGGIAALLIYTVFSYISVKRKTDTAVLLRDNIYQSENVISPFLLGIIKPKIYLPFNMNEQDMKLVIAHEQAHINRKDHWCKPFGFLLLTLHWFNPLMWLGYVLLCRDIEFACDEKVVKKFNNEQKADYSQALLTCSVKRRRISACPIAFGEAGVKERVKNVLNYKKPTFWIIAVAIVASVAVAVCFLTNPTSNKLKDIENRTLNSIIEETVAVWVSDGETYNSIGAISKNLLEDLSDIKISRKEISLNRSDRDASHTLVLQTKQDTDSTKYSYLEGLYIYFNFDFSSVWVYDGVKPTLSYKVINPEKAKEIFEHIKSLVDQENNQNNNNPNFNATGHNPYFNATVLEVYENSVLVEPFDGSDELKSADKITVSTNVVSIHPVPKLEKGVQIRIVYNGTIEEIYPANIPVVFAIYELKEIDGELSPVIATPLESDTK